MSESKGSEKHPTETEIDDTLEGTFPASDPPELAISESSRSEDHPTETEIDNTLEDTFPASDPPGWTLGIEHHSHAGNLIHEQTRDSG